MLFAKAAFLEMASWQQCELYVYDSKPTFRFMIKLSLKSQVSRHSVLPFMLIINAWSSSSQVLRTWMHILSSVMSFLYISALYVDRMPL